jgi:tRNA modification GTPase
VRQGETIAAIATPPGKGGIAIVRVSGPLVRELAARLIRAPSALAPRLATNVSIVDERGDTIDRALALFFPSPHSYTGEDVIEMHVHGSPVVARELVRALLACGARNAQPGEFTRRAFLNGKMDLNAALAVADLIDAETRSAARAALANLGGGLVNEVRRLRATLTSMLEELSAAIDFPDDVADPDPQELRDTIAALVRELERLQHDGEVGRLVREGIGVAIVGPPNAGKSSLLNALLGEERAIVSEIPGTTRDTIEERIVVDGVPVRLIDTAGIRAHADRLESFGIERTRRALASARIAIVVIDGSQPLSAEARTILGETRERARIVFFNKADLGVHGEIAGRNEPGTILGSVRDRESLAALRAAIANAGWGGELPDLERPHLAALHEFEAVGIALESLRRAAETLAAGEPVDLCAGELQRAFSALGHVSEQGAAEEVLTGIFSRFCIGK